MVSTEFPPLPGGIGRHAFDLCHELNKLGYKLHVITNSRNSLSAFKDLEFDKTCAFEISRVTRYKFSVLTYTMRIILVLRLLNKFKFNVVFLSGKFSLWLAPLIKFVLPDCNLIAITHGTELSGKGLGIFLTKNGLKNANNIVSVSNYTKSLALKLVPNKQIIVIHNGINQKRIPSNLPKVKLKGSPRIITVGNISKRKGQHNVINALPNLKIIFPNIIYHIIGLPTEWDKVKSLAKELDVEDSIEYHGVVSDDYLWGSLNSSDIFVMLSEKLENGDVEGFGIAIIEANHLGLPSIGSNNSGIVDAINNGFSGRLVPSNDPVAFCEAFQEIIINYEKYSQNARTWSEEFHWNQIINQYIQIL